MKKHYLLSIVILFAVVLASCAPAAAPAEEAPAVEEAPAEEAPAIVEDEWGYITIPAGESLKIGLSSALSGGYAVYGQDMLNGVEIAIDNFGDLEGFPIIVEGGDDLCEGAPGVTVAEQFCADPFILGVVGPMCSGTAVPASDIYGANNVLIITPSVTAVVVTARGYKNLFRIVANDDLQADVTKDYLMTELGVTKLGIINDQSIYGQGIADALETKFTDAGGTVTSNEGITRGETDYSAVISTVLADEPEAVYYGGMDAEGALIVNQLRKAGFEGFFFGPDGIKSKPSFVDASGGAAEGSFMTFGAVGGATGYDEFEAEFIEKFGGEPVAYGPGSYDAAMIMLQAAEKVATVDDDGNLVIGRKALADAVRDTPFDGITGSLKFTDTGDLSAVSITVFTVTDNEIVPVKEYPFGE